MSKRVGKQEKERNLQKGGRKSERERFPPHDNIPESCQLHPKTYERQRERERHATIFNKRGRKDDKEGKERERGRERIRERGSTECTCREQRELKEEREREE